MSRTVSALLVAVLALLAVPGIASALIQVDRGIAGARLGNTRGEVRAALGTPASTRSGSNPFGEFVQYRYRGGIRVIFQGKRTVTSVSTTGRGDRTASGVGVGSSERAVRRVSGVRCETIGGTRTCHTGEFLAGGRITDFLLRDGKVGLVTVGFVID